MTPSSLQISPEKDAEVARMHLAGDGYGVIARALRVSKSTVGRSLKRSAKAGNLGFKPVLPGYEVARTSVKLNATGEVVATYVTQRPERGEVQPVPDGHVVKGVSVLEDADGRVIQRWVKTREGLDTGDVIEALKTAFADVVPFAPPATVPECTFEDTVTLLPLPDMHVGMFAWGKETDRNWDTKIAEAAIGEAMHKLVSQTRPSKTAIVLGGGDAMHADNNDNKTAKSGNVLQVDGRYQKVLKATCRLFVRIVDLALARHESVIVRVLPGNHDEHASVAIAYFLDGWYRNEPRVVVDTDPSLFWWFRFGSTFLGATHGHAAKGRNMPQVMAVRRAEDWGASRHRYVHMFHVHHASKTLSEDGGVTVETHQAPCPQDAWHFNEGFLSGRSLSAIVYDRESGEIGRSNVKVL